MRLTPGCSVGPYKILGPLGAGGMGEVYRAKHVRLGREVAVKVLPDFAAEDPTSRERFEREARILGSLNHPNIATLHGLEDCGEGTLLEMELVPGETLAERIARGPMPPDKALPIFRQIAQALEAAHERGIIHRDLKPANVKITPEEQVKVLDFGLAKSFEANTPDKPQNSAMFTTASHPGVILGTMAYMSPEQVRGLPVDRRTDIWAFGCILYEALSGRPAFAMETMSDTLAAVLKSEPDWRALPPTPVALNRLVRRCLQKDPHARLRDIADARLEIDEALVETVAIPVPAAGPAGWQIPGRRVLGPAIGVAAIVALTAAGTWLAVSAPVPSSPVARLIVSLPRGQQLDRGGSPPIAVSANGSRLVYVALPRGGRTQLYLRPLDRFDAVAVPGTEGGSAPFFSADGQWVGFYANGALNKVSIEGGSPLRICDIPSVSNAAWGSNDTIVFATTASPNGLWQVPARGGTAERLTTADAQHGELQHGYPQILPSGDVVFGVLTDKGWNLAVLSLATKQWRALGPPGSGGVPAQLLSTGDLVYPQAGGLVTVPFDAKRTALGSPAPLLERVDSDASGTAAFAVSASGTLVYLPRAVAGPGRALTIVDRDGRATPLLDMRASYTHPRFSRDGKRLAVGIESENGADIWIYDRVRGNTRTRLTNDGGSRFPVWTPDGSRITFQAARAGRVSLFSQAIDSSEGPQPLLPTPQSGGLSEALAGLLPGNLPRVDISNPQIPMSWSADGEHLVFDERKPSAERDIWIASPSGEVAPFLRTTFDERFGAFSWNGKWLAYVSDESGRSEVYVQPYPGPGGKWVISTDGGTEPAWSPDGRELFYRHGDLLMAVPVQEGAEFTVGKAHSLFESHYETIDAARDYDVSPDGRFVMVRSEDASASEQFYVVLNWVQELRKRR